MYSRMHALAEQVLSCHALPQVHRSRLPPSGCKQSQIQVSGNHCNCHCHPNIHLVRLCCHLWMVSSAQVCNAPQRRFSPYNQPVSRNVNSTATRKSRKAELQDDSGYAQPFARIVFCFYLHIERSNLHDLSDRYYKSATDAVCFTVRF
jgi:hypothetical protein